jgi:hypothetical protein
MSEEHLSVQDPHTLKQFTIANMNKMYSQIKRLGVFFVFSQL